MHKVSLVWATPEAEKNILYCARVSNPKNQDSTNPKLLRYCADNKHWSIFEMGNLCVEIKTSRAISAQLLRHKSFSFQEFSQRYAEVANVIAYPARRQDVKNRQNTVDDLEQSIKDWWLTTQYEVYEFVTERYHKALELGIGKETARFILPMASETTLYMNGTIRSWIHYLTLRTDPSTQKEHRDIAESIKVLFAQEFPVIAEALGWE